jgi:hypothetical protein
MRSLALRFPFAAAKQNIEELLDLIGRSQMRAYSGKLGSWAEGVTSIETHPRYHFQTR